MICQKTGANVYLEQYGETVRGDFFDLGAVGIIRVTNASRSRVDPDVIHYRVGNVEKWWDEDSRYGTMIVTSWVYHGYDGEKQT